MILQSGVYEIVDGKWQKIEGDKANKVWIPATSATGYYCGWAKKRESATCAILREVG